MVIGYMVVLRRPAARKEPMPKLSDNQESSLRALKSATTDQGITYASKAAWKKACPQGVSVHGDAMVKTGAVSSVKAVVSTNGKAIELYTPAAPLE